ncbi:MAG TPA: hydroxyethylthiazole kinase [Candidatus Competibacteraceae bacterium]|nr:MAG: hydroxyethylthiazole kinase [Candidatus Competibacteraceae bacterium]HOB62958.1 hydroxyethylthiazole kinase [Candidatus Competibacteraceae bacterium]HQA27220.1 hydroxyethylthiazole kinase [Candidatus Competibacteraceae bacterium]HQD57292.1 hydroxyethylthiazole kinase [Candidatus Competibacteraceae bacterium]
MTTAATIWTLWIAVRAKQPLVHNITNFVVMNNSANALLALGASPAMIHACDEVEDFVAISQALVVNIGTLYSEQIAACKLAAARAKATGVPWILDPVGAGATPYRRAAAGALAQLRPNAIRGNGSEILTLAQQTQSGQGRGVDSLDASETALEAARQLATATGAAVAITGAVDYVTDGQRVVAIANGHPLMTRVTGLGCSATAVIGAFLAVEAEAFLATVAGLAVFAVAGEIAAEQARGPGSLQVALLDALYTMTQDDLARRLRLD